MVALQPPSVGDTTAYETTPVLSPRLAYDLFAEWYDAWAWQEFWHRNEWPLVRELVALGPPHPVTLDVGVGTGYYLAKLRRSSRAICGIDISAGMLRLARKRLGRRGCLIQADATALPLRPGIFDIVLVNRVASHISMLDRLAAEVTRVLAPTGRLIISDIAPEHDYCSTEFETQSGKVAVETYKHTASFWQDLCQRHHLKTSYLREITAANASWLPAAAYTSIDRTGKRPIGFVLAFDQA